MGERKMQKGLALLMVKAEQAAREFRYIGWELYDVIVCQKVAVTGGQRAAFYQLADHEDALFSTLLCVPHDRE